MLKIRHHQQETLGAADMERFVTAECERLTHLAQSENMALVADAPWVRKGIESGKTYGMDSESELARYNDLRLTLGDCFPGPDDLEVLESDELWGWQKLDELEGRLALTAE